MFFNPFKALHPELGYSLTSTIWSAHVHCDLSRNNMCVAGEDQNGRERFVAVIYHCIFPNILYIVLQSSFTLFCIFRTIPYSLYIPHSVFLALFCIILQPFRILGQVQGLCPHHTMALLYWLQQYDFGTLSDSLVAIYSSPHSHSVNWHESYQACWS